MLLLCGQVKPVFRKCKSSDSYYCPRRLTPVVFLGPAAHAMSGLRVCRGRLFNDDFRALQTIWACGILRVPDVVAHVEIGGEIQLIIRDTRRCSLEYCEARVD